MSARAKKRFVVKPAVPLNSDINVTPLVDVVLVLLIIFMVVTPLLEKDIGVRVPDTEQVREDTPPPPDQLVVRVSAQGEVQLNDERVERAELAAKLRPILERQRRPEDRIVFIVADDGAVYGTVVEVLDSAKAAGAQTLGMMTELPEATPP
ncbi:biopolymer transporter ExbD [Sorangium cellulosum]|uniref:Biopolymer transporter ExbD n=1 Tax=Sorangium cellulosum TaxID=56 RepID=A0A4P2Q2J5_SORCE|nr:biopolymer transporter ExbD [Sorangium cellulosum]AUX23470.1 biopolymer transporter ExbD [Sorangium cellulosum]